MELRDAHVMVTGASRGIGRELVDVLHAQRATVSLVARSGPMLEEIVAAVGPDRAAAFA